MAAIQCGLEEEHFDNAWRTEEAGYRSQISREEAIGALRYVDDMILLSFLLCDSCLARVPEEVYPSVEFERVKQEEGRWSWLHIEMKWSRERGLVLTEKEARSKETSSGRKKTRHGREFRQTQRGSTTAGWHSKSCVLGLAAGGK